jgi:hypothetical protein
LRFGKLLIGEHAEAQLFRIEVERPVLVPNRDAQEFYSFDHAVKNATAASGNQESQREQAEISAIAATTIVR